MPVGAPLGNKNNTKTKPWSQAIKFALEDYSQGQVERTMALRAIAKKMIEQAIDGDKDARKEIGDRLDGKPVQAIAGEDGGPLTIEIVRFASTDTE